MAPEQFLLAILSGIGFGYIVYRMGSTTARLAVMLVMLYVFQTFAQQVYRVVEGTGSMNELLTVSGLRLAFSVAAVLILFVLNRRA